MECFKRMCCFKKTPLKDDDSEDENNHTNIKIVHGSQKESFFASTVSSIYNSVYNIASAWSLQGRPSLGKNIFTMSSEEMSAYEGEDTGFFDDVVDEKF